MTAYLCNKQDLIALCQMAELKGYNRQLDTEKLQELEADKFVLQPLMLHEHVMGVSQPPENCQQRVMVTDGKKQTVGFLDIQIGVWNEAVKDSVPVPSGE